MKRKLLIVLALLLVCTVLAAAVSLAFTDDAEIGDNYSAAIADMVERGVLDGFEDGSFRPDA